MREEKFKNVTFPIPDTMSGPGTFHGKANFEGSVENGNIPSVEVEDSLDEFGFGTAQDVAEGIKPFRDDS